VEAGRRAKVVRHRGLDKLTPGDVSREMWSGQARKEMDNKFARALLSAINSGHEHCGTSIKKNPVAERAGDSGL
jgi:hypothetical protein